MQLHSLHSKISLLSFVLCVGIFFSCIGIKFYCAAGKPLIIFNQNGHIMSPEYKVVHTEWLEAKVWPIWVSISTQDDLISPPHSHLQPGRIENSHPQHSLAARWLSLLNFFPIDLRADPHLDTHALFISLFWSDVRDEVPHTCSAAPIIAWWIGEIN